MTYERAKATRSQKNCAASRRALSPVSSYCRASPISLGICVSVPIQQIYALLERVEDEVIVEGQR